MTPALSWSFSILFAPFHAHLGSFLAFFSGSGWRDKSKTFEHNQPRSGRPSALSEILIEHRERRHDGGLGGFLGVFLRKTPAKGAAKGERSFATKEAGSDSAQKNSVCKLNSGLCKRLSLGEPRAQTIDVILCRCQNSFVFGQIPVIEAFLFASNLVFVYPTPA